MEFRQLEAFVNVIKHKSFSKAADAAFLSQPTISLHIASLENELGLSLLKRQGRQIVASPEGEQFYNYALNLLLTRDKAKAAMAAVNQDLQGIIELQSSSVPAQVFLPTIMADFRAKQSKIKFYLEQSDSASVLENLARGQGELGFVGSEDKAAGFIYQPLFQDQDVLITAATGKFAALKEPQIELEQFINEPFIWRESGSATGQVLTEIVKNSGKPRQALDIVAKTNSNDWIISSVAAGLGVAIISKKVAQLQAGQRNLRIFEIKGWNKKRTFYMVQSKDAVLSAAATAFRDYIGLASQ